MAPSRSPHFFCIWTLTGCSRCWARTLGMKYLICCKILRFRNFAIPNGLYWAATTKPRQIKRSSFFYWTTTAKLEFTDQSRVHSMFSATRFSDGGGLLRPPP